MSFAAQTVPGKGNVPNVSRKRQSLQQKNKKDWPPQESPKGGKLYRFGDVFGYKPVGYLGDDSPVFSNKLSKLKKLEPKKEHANIEKDIDVRTSRIPLERSTTIWNEKETGHPKRKGIKLKAPVQATEIVDIAYRGRVKTLEAENKELLDAFDSLYKENKLLREKLNSVTGKDILIEPYRQIVTDRETLREAETTYRNRISRLEKDNKGAVHTVISVNQENQNLRRKIEKLEEKEYKAYEYTKKAKDLTAVISKLERELEVMCSQKHQCEMEILKMKELLAERDATIKVLLGRSEVGSTSEVDRFYS